MSGIKGMKFKSRTKEHCKNLGNAGGRKGKDGKRHINPYALL